MRARHLLPLLVLVAVIAAPTAASARTRRFVMPSKRIACLYDSASAYLRCDALFLNDVAYVLHRHGRGKRVHVTDTVFDTRAPVLRYGHRLRLGPFTCASRRTGLTCRTRANGHGFTISRERRKVF
jgi:uncharacterized protein DUF6636